MQQEDFMNFKDHISAEYTNHHFSSSGSTFCDIHWLNFGWGEEVHPVTKKVTLVHHPNEVWMRCTYSDGEPWKKVRILKDRPGNVALERLYPNPLIPAAAKVRDLKKMARDYIPSPQRNFYLEMTDDDDGVEREHEDDD